MMMQVKRRIGQETYPAGHQPYDALSGLRVGAVAGGIIGVIPVALGAPGGVWLVLIGGFIGGVVGYQWERRLMRDGSSDS